MAQHGIGTMLARPDFYPYGAVARANAVNALVDNLATDLRRQDDAISRQHSLTVSKPAGA